MLKRMVFTLLITCLASAAIAQPTIYTYAAHWEVPRADWAAFTTDNGANAALDRLVADGTLMWWSNIETFVHSVEGTTHGTMWAATSLDGIEKTLDELAKLPPGPMIEGIKHHDHLWVSMAHGGKSANNSGGYMWMTVNQTVPGQGGRWLEIQKKYYEPVYKKLIADGSLLVYDIAREYVHRANPRRRFTFLVSPNAEANAKVRQALSAVPQEHADIIFSAFAETSERSEHRDVLFHTTKFTHK